MLKQLRLLSQYNRKSMPVKWSDYFTVVSMKDKYHVVVQYEPDSYLSTLRNSKFDKKRINKRISSYDFDDESFSNIVQQFLKYGFKVTNVDWDDKTKSRISDEFDFDGVDLVADFDSAINNIIHIVPRGMQVITKLTFSGKNDSRLKISRYGVVTILNTDEEKDIISAVKDVLL